MAWPRATDYTAAIQNPASCFRDPELSRGQAASDMLMGLPLMYSGNFASVFKITCPGEQVWAVKCFTRQVSDLQERYQRISDHLDRQRRKFAVEFVYLPEGIRINGAWYPILKMRWVEGFTLNEFLRDHAGQPALIEQLGLLWLRLASELRDAKMAHGDLQHGNVMLVPGSKSTSIALRLIDYDGMWVPALASRPPGEVGHPNFQHPARLASGGYTSEIDRFSHLVIYSALRFLAVGGKALWDRHDNAENLLFRAADFRAPGKSKLVGDLLALPGEDLRLLLGHLFDASRQPLDAVPLLNDLIDGTHVVPLSRDQVTRLQEILPDPTWPAPAPPRIAATVLLPAMTVAAPTMPTVLVSLSKPTTAPTILLPDLPPQLPMVLGPTTVIMDALPAVVPTPTRKELPRTQVAPRSPAPPPARNSIPPPPRRRLPWPELPAWARLGLSARSPIVRYWPVTLGILLSLPGLAIVAWLVSGLLR